MHSNLYNFTESDDSKNESSNLHKLSPCCTGNKISTDTNENSYIEVLPERLIFSFIKDDLNHVITKKLKIYNKSTAPIKIIIFPSETKNFIFKPSSKTCLVPGVPMTVTIVFNPTHETEYTDWLRVCCPNDCHLVFPVIAFPYMEKNNLMPKIFDSGRAFTKKRLTKCCTVNSSKTIKHVKPKSTFRKILRFKLVPEISSEKKNEHKPIPCSSKQSFKTLTRHDVNLALMRKHPFIRDYNEQSGPDGLFLDQYLEKRRKGEAKFFEKVREIQQQDSIVERNHNFERLFALELPIKEIEKVEKERSILMTEQEEQINGTENDGKLPIHVRQKVITKYKQNFEWIPPKQEPDLWIFRYQVLWKFIQAARSVLIYNRMLKRLGKLKLHCMELKKNDSKQT